MKKLIASVLAAGLMAAGLGLAPAQAAGGSRPEPADAIAAFDASVVSYEQAVSTFVANGRPVGEFKTVKQAFKVVVKNHQAAIKSIGAAFKAQLKQAKIARKAGLDAASTVDDRRAARTAYNQTVAALIVVREGLLADLGSLPAKPSKQG